MKVSFLHHLVLAYFIPLVVHVSKINCERVQRSGVVYVARVVESLCEYGRARWVRACTERAGGTSQAALINRLLLVLIIKHHNSAGEVWLSSRHC